MRVSARHVSSRFSIVQSSVGIFIFLVQVTTSRIGNPSRLVHTLLYVMTIHTYIHTSIETLFFSRCSGLGRKITLLSSFCQPLRKSAVIGFHLYPSHRVPNPFFPAGGKPPHALGAPSIMGLHGRVRHAGIGRHRHPRAASVLRAPIRRFCEYLKRDCGSSQPKLCPSTRSSARRQKINMNAVYFATPPSRLGSITKIS